MNKELYVSTTPHETKVGITEDDQLAEIYLERENEYTLAGSIYKGRVTRVLPGMQSAFVDIGLERDAFLYVSDFMDLEQQDEDLDEAIPAKGPATEVRPRNGSEAGGLAAEAEHMQAGSDVVEGGDSTAGGPEAPAAAGVSRDFRGRRRRRGRRGDNTGRGPSPARGEVRTEPRVETSHEPRQESRNDRFSRGDRPGRGVSDARFQRPAPSARVGHDYDSEPPPGYQPIILPGESISKYQRQSQSPALPAETAPAEPPVPASAAIISTFPEDEPIFAAAVAEPLHEQHEHVLEAEIDEDVDGNVASAPPEPAEVRNELRAVAEPYSPPATGVHESDFVSAPPIADQITSDVTHGTMEEQEIEEEEADLASYGEEPGDDEGFEELEEETRAAGGVLSEPDTGENSPEPAAGAEPVVNDEGVPEAVLEAEEREAEELELEEAQAEAEALLEAEAIGDGTVDASAEVRAPAPEARLLQRTQRRGPERGSDRGGPERRGGGRGGGRFCRRGKTGVAEKH